jgi:hypothetical protein
LIAQALIAQALIAQALIAQTLIAHAHAGSRIEHAAPNLRPF